MSRFEFLEGRAHAANALTSAFSRPDDYSKESGITQVLDNLRAALPHFPKDYAAGMQSVITRVQHAIKRST